MLLEEELSKLQTLLSELVVDDEQKELLANRIQELEEKIRTLDDPAHTSEIEGYVKQADFINDFHSSVITHKPRLVVLIQAKTGTLYNTFIQKKCTPDERICEHLKQMFESLRHNVYERDSQYYFMRKTVRVTVAKPTGDNDLPLYPVLKQYALLQQDEVRGCTPS